MKILHNHFYENGALNVKRLVDFLEDDLLEYEGFPQEYLKSIIHMFSSDVFFIMPDIWKVLHMLTVEDLTREQFYEISVTLRESFNSYKDNMLIDMSCDFIARTCQIDSAIEMLYEMAVDTHEVGQASAIFTGINIVKNRTDYDASKSDRLNDVVNAVSSQ